MAGATKSRKYPASHRPAEFDSGTLRVLQALVTALLHGLFAMPPLPRPGESTAFLWIGDTFAGRDARPVDLRESQGCVTIGTRTAVQAQTVALTIAVLPTHSPLAAFWLLRFVPAM